MQIELLKDLTHMRLQRLGLTQSSAMALFERPRRQG